MFKWKIKLPYPKFDSKLAPKHISKMTLERGAHWFLKRLLKSNHPRNKVQPPLEQSPATSGANSIVNNSVFGASKSSPATSGAKSSHFVKSPPAPPPAPPRQTNAYYYYPVCNVATLVIIVFLFVFLYRCHCHIHGYRYYKCNGYLHHIVWKTMGYHMIFCNVVKTKRFSNSI